MTLPELKDTPPAAAKHTRENIGSLPVRRLLNRERRPLRTILPESSAQAAIQLMAGERISALPVVSDGVMVGIVSERDYVRKVASRDIPPWTVQVREIMTGEVITVTSEDPLSDCMRLMADHRIRHLPVMEAGKLIAIVSITDIVRELESGLPD